VALSYGVFQARLCSVIYSNDNSFNDIMLRQMFSRDEEDVFGTDYSRLARTAYRTRHASLTTRMMRQSTTGSLLKQTCSNYNSLGRQSSNGNQSLLNHTNIPGFRSRSSSVSSTASFDSSWFKPSFRASYGCRYLVILNFTLACKVNILLSYKLCTFCNNLCTVFTIVI